MEVLMPILLIVAVLIYFTPALTAQNRRHRNADAIAIINIFLGWTFLGWVIALAWAMTDNTRPPALSAPRVQDTPAVIYEPEPKPAGLSNDFSRLRP